MNSEEHIEYIDRSTSKAIPSTTTILYKKGGTMDGNDYYENDAYASQPKKEERTSNEKESTEDDYNVDADFRREMNTAKISYVAYKRAVHHLTTCYKSEQQKSYTYKEEEEEEGEMEEQRDDDDIIEANKNSNIPNSTIQKLSSSLLLEHEAKHIVETKAKACFEAVHIANYFNHVREERMNGRNALFKELLTVGCGGRQGMNTISSRRNHALERNDSENGNKDIDDKNNKGTKDAKEDASSTNMEKQEEQHFKTNNTPSKCIRSTAPLYPSSASSNKRGTHPKYYVTIRPQKTKHWTTCSSSATPSPYGTTRWIQSIVPWKIQNERRM